MQKQATGIEGCKEDCTLYLIHRNILRFAIRFCHPGFGCPDARLYPKSKPSAPTDHPRSRPIHTCICALHTVVIWHASDAPMLIYWIAMHLFF